MNYVLAELSFERKLSGPKKTKQQRRIFSKKIVPKTFSPTQKRKRESERERDVRKKEKRKFVQRINKK